MNTVTNTSMQGISIPFKTPQGVKYVFLAPSQNVQVPDNWDSKIVKNLVRRRMVRMVYSPDVTPVPTVVPALSLPSKKPLTKFKSK